MKYLGKKADSEILSKKLNYRTISHRTEIRQILIEEQKEFCAYSERFIKNTDIVDIEHFDGRLKHTDQDGYYNWYGVISWFNSHKPKNIDPYLPILEPHSVYVKTRIVYEDGIYSTNNENDIEAKNLINYLGLNKYELHKDRMKHVSRIKDLFHDLLDSDEEALKQRLKKDKEYLSFCTALEHEFGMNLDELIFEK